VVTTEIKGRGKETVSRQQRSCVRGTSKKENGFAPKAAPRQKKGERQKETTRSRTGIHWRQALGTKKCGELLKALGEEKEDRTERTRLERLLKGRGKKAAMAGRKTVLVRKKKGGKGGEVAN